MITLHVWTVNSVGETFTWVDARRIHEVRSIQLFGGRIEFRSIAVRNESSRKHPAPGVNILF